MRKNILIASLVSIIFLMSGMALALPDPAVCNNCHGSLDNIYQEWVGSKHKENNVVCFGCHIPSAFQSALLYPGEKKGFQVLGYYNVQTQTWVRQGRKELCIGCHHTAHHNNNIGSKDECVNCHMPIEGLTTYRVHKITSEHPSISFENIYKYVTREHRMHKVLGCQHTAALRSTPWNPHFSKTSK